MSHSPSELAVHGVMFIDFKSAEILVHFIFVPSVEELHWIYQMDFFNSVL